ncbi:hypothetical protein ACHAWF_012242 [Thalassiosira exigua]
MAMPRPRRTALLVLGFALLLLLPPSIRALSAPAPKRSRVVVVGAGVGGLATAARVASRSDDAEVVVVEKNGPDARGGGAGGRCGSFDVALDGWGTFRHERGPSLLLLKDEYERLFAECAGRDDDPDADAGCAARRYGLEMKQCIPAYQAVFEDGKTVKLGFPRSKCSRGLSLDEIKDIQIQEQESVAAFDSLEPDGHRKWTEYLDTCAAYLDCGLPNFIEEKLDVGSFPAFLNEALRDGGKRWPLRPHSSMLESLFESPELRALASFQDLYVGLSPYADSRKVGGGVWGKTAPAVFGLLAAIELHPTNDKAGVFAPVGGFRSVSEAMRRLCVDLGVEFRFDASVTSIADDGVHYVTSGEEEGREGSERGFLPADLVICNADLPFATETIARPTPSSSKSSSETMDNEARYESTYDWDSKYEFSSGVVAFHWSISRPLDALETHNVFLGARTADEAEESWAVLRSDDGEGATAKSTSASMESTKGRSFNFYVHRAGKTDPTACPPGSDAIMVLGYKAQFDPESVAEVRAAVLDRLAVLEGLEDLEKDILDEVVDTPGTYAEYYNVGAGVPFGLSHGLGQLSLLRPGAESKTHENLLYVGASSRPGNGVPLVLVGSRQVADKAMKKLEQL